MIVFTEKVYTKPTLANKVKRALIPALEKSVGMSKKGAIKSVARTSTSGVKKGLKEVTSNLPKEAKIGAALGTATPVPAGSVFGAIAGGQVSRIRQHIYYG